VKSLASRWRTTWRVEEKSWCSGEHQAADGRRKRTRSFSPATEVLVIGSGECLASPVHQSTNSSKRRDDLELAEGVAQCDTLESACTICLELNRTCDQMNAGRDTPRYCPRLWFDSLRKFGRMVVRPRAIARMVA
jgi:hypothetical protein